MRTMEYQTAEKQRQKSLETMEIYAPSPTASVCSASSGSLRICRSNISTPSVTRRSPSRLKKQREHESFMERVQAQIEARLKEQHVPYLRVYGRMKHLQHLPQDVRAE